MKNTLMFLLVSLLLASSLTACGGGSQTNGSTDTYGATGQTGTNGSAGDYGAAGQSGTNGSAAGGAVTRNDGITGSAGQSGTAGSADGSLVDDARDALDDAGRAVRDTVDSAARGF